MMPYLVDKNSILNVIRNNPEYVRRIWIEKGFEGVSQDIIKELKRQGIPFKIILKDAFIRKFKDVRSHVVLEREEIIYTDQDVLLKEVRQKKICTLCAFDGIFDPQNLGNIIRSAACLGVDAIIIPKDRSCGITETVVKISKGGIEHVKIVKVVNLARYIDEMKDAGVFCYCLDEKGETPLFDIDLKGRTCLVFGSEEGLRRLTRDKCDAIARIPTNSIFSSLNVATCFAVSIYEVIRQKGLLKASDAY
ncbi:MAG TPA: 23S rRNA (guanosine(2251)-2'-O)-methyltransferase RlmB [Syntrophorhabdaceae bacterium]|jgi:23S rRNA (guanosine2251-2'-O)-methyltransferase|nr:23S rRNA (guanosine(2251)-2'-O)-methyltransferase RlmB [Syntrophorhabdaceae bacterium]MDI9561012.1 23S rRNA (guanosine(2251)-2'-O)-methyltransferase RlmB [Pseudomonadota bacterium]HNQ64136.1 23S rRNA (guanosine(2251)-2'-O)-methyltransferase RlmB [Syntrophorhabdaceae bacterium]HNZ57896.1 23S rRNA (guanosine(2251)-2'-O)-methyltransferase RlmB [Syntrophorhabdaceae bacterium]HOF56851.1 23S rRNA (guanosine(2251)-2'-O)-methyltransferase RlmB [Syntrophorhabdaceae bacterium]